MSKKLKNFLESFLKIKMKKLMTWKNTFLRNTKYFDYIKKYQLTNLFILFIDENKLNLNHKIKKMGKLLVETRMLNKNTNQCSN